MKSFKKFLAEDITTVTTGDTTVSKAQSVPYIVPGSTPTLPGGWPYKPQDKPQGKPEDTSEEKPTIIDWQQIDDRVQELLSTAEFINQMLQTLGWDAFVIWFSNTYGVRINDTSDIIRWFEDHSNETFHDWFEQTYPNATQEQSGTLFEILNRMRDKFYDIWRNPPIPGDPGTPFGGADDPRYRPFSLQDPTTWENADPFHPDFYRGPYPNDSDDTRPPLSPLLIPPKRFQMPQNPYPGTYQA